MKGFIKKIAAGCCFSALLFAITGCYHYRNLVDPCWPDRYNFMARDSVRHMHYAQADAGHELGQTIFNWHFETTEKGPSARLNQAGIEALQVISRRKPAPDAQLFLQHAQDIPYVQGANADDVIRRRAALNEERKKSIEEFLKTQSAVLGGGGYQIAVRDVEAPGINARPIIGTRPTAIPGAAPQMERNFTGTLPPVGTTTGGGGAGGGGGTTSGGGGYMGGGGAGGGGGGGNQSGPPSN